MAVNKPVNCSVCGKPIRTLRESGIGKASVVCRDCFGESSYGGNSGHWNFNQTPGERSSSDGVSS